MHQILSKTNHLKTIFNTLSMGVLAASLVLKIDKKMYNLNETSG